MIKNEAFHAIQHSFFLFLDKIDLICSNCGDSLATYSLTRINSICYIENIDSLIYDSIW
jgi:hypothetical protein